jgi:periplasmic protein TonB
MMTERGNFDDLVFENRNKEYGAYDIRKKYNFFLVLSLFASLLIGSASVVIPFLKVLGMVEEPGSGGGGRRLVSVQMEKLDLPDEEIFVAPAIPPPPAGIPQVEKYVAPIIADTVLPTDNIQQAVSEIQATNPDNTSQEIVVSSNASESELTGGDLGDGGDEPFILVEVKPTFRGGDIEKFREWVQKRVAYPQEAQDNGIHGKVYLTFVVERDGSVSNVNIVRSVDPLIDKEAQKAIEASPKWSPGLQRGRPVRVRFSIFLNFTL